MLTYALIAVIAILVFISNDFLETIISKGFKSYDRKDWLRLLLNIIIVGLLLGQNFYNNYLNDKKEESARVEKLISDSVIRASSEANTFRMIDTLQTENRKTIGSITDILTKYGYKLDSTKKSLIKIIKDSSKTRVIMPENPVLKMVDLKYYSTLEEFGNSYNVYLASFKSYDASSTNFNITLSVYREENLGKYKTRFVYIGSKLILQSNFTIPKDKTDQYKIVLPNDSTLKLFYIVMHGSYCSMEKLTKIPVTQTYCFDVVTNQFKKVIGETSGFLKKGIDKEKIIYSL